MSEDSTLENTISSLSHIIQVNYTIQNMVFDIIFCLLSSFNTFSHTPSLDFLVLQE